ncbi:MAG: nucleoside 2-deoxyribosyltransferase domain-containing protein [Methanomassiliicoccales archaeon]|jgi:nucleoside 2-deoxyribosyltransferase
MNIITYETPCNAIDLKQPTIFLAGPTVRGNQYHLLPSWRDEAIKLFQQANFHGNLIVPEFLKTTISDKYRYDLPEWEFFGLSNCHVILFWIPRTKELIGLTTNYEIGYWTARDRKKIVYGRPDNAYRIQYLDVMWYADGKQQNHEEQNYPIYNTLPKTVVASLQLTKNILSEIAKANPG